MYTRVVWWFLGLWCRGTMGDLEDTWSDRLLCYVRVVIGFILQALSAVIFWSREEVMLVKPTETAVARIELGSPSE